jgi:hypothetical protein
LSFLFRFRFFFCAYINVQPWESHSGVIAEHAEGLPKLSVIRGILYLFRCLIQSQDYNEDTFCRPIFLISRWSPTGRFQQ